MARQRCIIWSLSLALGVAAGLSLPDSAAARHGSRAHAAIVGGATAPAGTWPWLAYIFDNLGDGSYGACMGTVVAPNLVLTTAHCVEDVTTGVLDPRSGFGVITGRLDLADTASGQVSAVSELITHAVSWQTRAFPSGATSINVVGDAALVVLATPTAAPAITLADSSDLSLIQPGDTAEEAGWGLTVAGASTPPTALQAATTVIQSPDYCVLRNLDFDSLAQLCAVDAPLDSESICNGDSGGPLVVETSASTWVEVGITSASDNGCDPTLPDTFTRADYVQPWVQGWIAALPPPAPTPGPPTRTPAAPAAPSLPTPPQIGSYDGTSNQHSGHVGLTDATGGLVRIRVEFNLHCPRGRRGPFVVTDTWSPSAPLTLSVVGGALGFSTAFNDKAGWHYTINGQFPTVGTATGTFKVTTRNGQCTTGLVSWTSSTPTG